MKHNTRRWRGLCCNINSLNGPPFKYSVSKIGESIMMNLLKKLAACGPSPDHDPVPGRLRRHR